MKRFLIPFLFATVALAQHTPNINLNLPPFGTPNWDRLMNQNFTTLDNYLGGITQFPHNLKVPGLIAPGGSPTSCFHTDGSTGACSGGGGGSGTVNAGTTGQVAVYPSNGTTVQGATALPNGITATTQTANDNSVKLATTAYVDTSVTLAINTIKTNGSPFIVPATTGFYWNNTASAYSFDIPAPVVGLQMCFGNYQARNSAVSIIPSTGVTIYFKGNAGTVGSPTGLVSAGAVGDFICVVATDSTTYMAIGAGFGTWTNN